ncbi:uncharacterized protein E0L32_011436 [Thyridium curvatum]|uniref:FAD dependent oxidoreductase domain-containing protein n=1 Tax=Thyridium curvatum TaxID=1093900 RepID=A0A507BJ96_9PEZI|nr:uncharacterized protein E0L32_011436 [Thyridium curvatum]TPX18884.1 hypothetical protein E0L32_011436 [Thyridium curvatum]
MPPASSSSPSSFSPPSSILIVGSGVFGLSTAYALSQRPAFAGTAIRVVDRTPDQAVFPSRDASSIDTSRIIRPDYADPAYADLAAEAQVHWRRQGPDELGGQGRYTESGLALVADGDIASVPSQGQDSAKKDGVGYVRASWDNISAMAQKDPALQERIRFLPTKEAIRDAVRTGGTSGSSGYLNSASGWADAEASMKWLYDRVKSTGRVEFISGTVAALERDGDRVSGVKLSDGAVLAADLVVLATGAWTGALLDLTGHASATGQVLGYIDITEEEQAALSKMPVLLNLTTGVFVIPPANRLLKVARHAYGYLNPSSRLSPLPPSPASAPSKPTVSLPMTHLTNPDLVIPDEGVRDLREGLREMVPLPAIHDRPFKYTRLCWYTDTPDGDFIIDYHPSWKGLFLATGGSGHGFKFLPVIGDKIVDTLSGNCPPAFKGKWSLKDSRTFSAWDSVVTEDGSRGGIPGLILERELKASEQKRSKL